MLEYDHVVIGGGIVGSWTAYHIAKLGKKVLLLEQFGEPHTRGSSHGQTRLIRACYEEEFFAALMPYAFNMWRKAEQESGKKLMETCGVLCLYDTSAKEESYQKCISNLRTYSPEALDLNQKREDLFSKQLHYKEKPHAVLFDKLGGVLFAHRAVLAIQDLFRKEGGHLWDNTPVKKIIPNADKVDIVTEKGLVSAKSVVVSAGAWTKKLLVPDVMSSLPLQPAIVKVHYWREKTVGAHTLASGFPALIDLTEPDVYAIPSIEYPGLVKVCCHGGSPCDPDKRDQYPFSEELVKRVKGFVSEHMPLLEDEPAVVETCMYTLTPDEVFLIDRVPGHKNIIIGSGFSGTGFKTSPAVGRLLSEMATNQETFLDISPYKLSRFNKD